MAKYFLINTVSVNINGALQKFLPGHLIDDASVDSTLVSGAGGELWPFADAIVAAAAADVSAKHLQRAINEAEMESLMRAAAENSIASGGGGVSSYANVYTYRQGGVAAKNVFTTFALAYAAAIAATLVGAIPALVVDSSLGTPVTGACGVIDLSHIDLVGASSSYISSTLTFQTGTTVSEFRGVRRLSLLSTSANPVCSLVGGTHYMPVVERSGVTGGTAANFFDVSGAAVIIFALGDSSTFVNGTNRVVQAAAGCTVAVYLMGGGSALGTTTLGGGGDFQGVSWNPTATLAATQVNVSGTYTLSLSSLASQVAATDTAPLLGATTTQGQLDALKATRAFVWQPGGVAGSGIYTTWASLVAAVASVNGHRRIVVDTSLGAAVIPAGAWVFNPAGIFGTVEISCNDTNQTPAATVTVANAAVTIAGLTHLTGVLVIDQSTSDLITMPATTWLTLAQGAGIVPQAAKGAAASIKSTTGTNGIWFLEGAFVATFDTGVDGIQVTGGTFIIQLRNASTLGAGMLKKTGGAVVVAMDNLSTYAAQANAAAVVPTGARAKGTTTLVNGVSPLLTCTGLAAGSSILFNYRTPNGSTLTTKMAVLNADRTLGAQGTFKISALKSDETVNAADGSTVDWIAFA